MKVIIDLIEDIRESIANAEEYQMMAGLLKADSKDATKLHYAGEAPLGEFRLDENARVLRLYVKPDGMLRVGELIPKLLIMDMDTMMYEIKVEVNDAYSNMEVVGFGKSDEEKRYILFIKV